jgi:EAL domain-containing protein (putative c-di-GMP-specific phosphodiesterase class I)
MEAGLEPERLTLEITESVLMSDPERSHRILAQLERRDIRACIDDFGTGYSSLSYLHRFPIDALKIDRSFVADLGVDQKASEIIRSIMMLAHRLGWKVVAEGVSTREQLIELLALGCPYAQGFLFSPPVDADRITEVLAQGPTWKNFLATDAAQAATGTGTRAQRIALRWGD